MVLLGGLEIPFCRLPEVLRRPVGTGVFQSEVELGVGIAMLRLDLNVGRRGRMRAAEPAAETRLALVFCLAVVAVVHKAILAAC